MGDDNDKDIKIQNTKYQKLVKELNKKNIIFPEEFVTCILIEKLSNLWKDYKQQLKHRSK